MKGATAGKHLIQNCSKGKNIRTVIHRSPTDLLRGHITHRPHHYTRISIDSPSWNICRNLTAVRLSEFGQTEVEYLHAAVTGDEDVFRLQIAMNDSFLVSCGEAVGDL